LLISFLGSSSSLQLRPKKAGNNKNDDNNDIKVESFQASLGVLGSMEQQLKVPDGGNLHGALLYNILFAGGLDSADPTVL
jgi:hypothetical protein